MLAIILSGQTANGQGSIFGEVTNIDLSIPANGEINFIGFIKGKDNEIRIESADGAGYDNGNWFDDFQNYLGESSGDQFDYLFFNRINNFGFHLLGQIPNNSFQQEDVPLGSVNWPEPPTLISVFFNSENVINISWSNDFDLVYHIYRRNNGSSGSFFRVDNPAGEIAGSGISGKSFADSSVTSALSYDYLILSKNELNQFSPHPEIVTVTYSEYCCQLKGDVNADGTINILDLTVFISYLFKNGPEPGCVGNVDMSVSGDINIRDLTYFISFLFKNGAPLPDCQG